VSNNLRSSEVHFTSEFEEHLWIHIKFNSSHSLLVGCVYRSPPSNLENSTNSLCQLLRQVTSSSSSYLICGDFNYSNIDWNNMCVTSSSSKTQSFIDMVQDQFMCQHVMEPTRFRGDATPHILNLVFTNNENMIENLKFLPGFGNSDHLCISFDVGLPVCQTSDSESVLKYNVYCADYTKMRMLLSTINWECDMENLMLMTLGTSFQELLMRL